MPSINYLLIGFLWIDFVACGISRSGATVSENIIVANIGSSLFSAKYANAPCFIKNRIKRCMMGNIIDVRMMCGCVARTNKCLSRSAVCSSFLFIFLCTAQLC